jgi:hypothetical protein
MGLWRNVGYIIATIIIAAGVICFIAAIAASPKIETQPTELEILQHLQVSPL